MKVLKIIYVFLVLIFLTELCESPDSNLSKSNRKKRSIYVVNILDVIGHASSVFGLIDPIIDLIKKDEDKVFEILISNIDSIKDRIKTHSCLNLEQYYLYPLCDKIHTLFEYLNNYQIHSHINDAKESTKNICKDPSEGIGKIHSLFSLFLKSKEVKKYFKECYQYKSDDLKNWLENVHNISRSIAILIEGCEKVFGKSVFNRDKFLKEVKSLLEYNQHEIIFNEFINDESNFGLKNIMTTNLFSPVHNQLEKYCFPDLFKEMWHQNEKKLGLICYKVDKDCRKRGFCIQKFRFSVPLYTHIDHYSSKSFWNNKPKNPCLLDSKQQTIEILDTVSIWSESFESIRRKMLGFELKNNLRLTENYDSFKTSKKQYDPKECLKKCNQDPKCFAFAVSTVDWAKNTCFLYGNEFGTDFGMKNKFYITNIISIFIK
jgi:hypothetical protein